MQVTIGNKSSPCMCIQSITIINYVISMIIIVLMNFHTSDATTLPQATVNCVMNCCQGSSAAKCCRKEILILIIIITKLIINSDYIQFGTLLGRC